MSRRSRSSSRSSRRSRSRSVSSDIEGVRVHVGELPVGCSERELEHMFKKFGPLVEVWMAKIPPCFAFVVFRDKEDAEEAVRAMNGRTVCGRRVRVSIARPRVEARGTRRTVYSGDSRCYQCGERGHLSRNCYAFRSQRPGPSRKRHRSSSSEKSSRSRSRSRSRARKSGRSRKSRDRSHEKESSERRYDEKSEKRSSSKRSKDKEETDTKNTEKDKSDKQKAESSRSDDKAEVRKVSIVSDRAASADKSP